MVQINNINIDFLNLKTELYFHNNPISIDTTKNTVTIVSGPQESLIPIYNTKDITLVQNKQITQTIKQ